MHRAGDTRILLRSSAHRPAFSYHPPSAFSFNSNFFQTKLTKPCISALCWRLRFHLRPRLGDSYLQHTTPLMGSGENVNPGEEDEA